MPDRRAVTPDNARTIMSVYAYDGSFDGLLCCVFESYQYNEMPVDVLSEELMTPGLLPVKAISTCPEHAQRVRRAIPKKMGARAYEFIRNAFLTCCPQKEINMLRFIRMGFRRGPAVMDCLTEEAVHTLFMAVNHLNREVNHYLGFIRFSDSGGVLTSQIEPKNIVLPLMARHFAERYPNERFLIFDKTHGLALLHQDHAVKLFSAEEFYQPRPGAEEAKFRALWKLFYDTIEIKERHNPRCRMNHMPKRFWHCMTEFSKEIYDETDIAVRALPPAAEEIPYQSL